MRFTIFAFEGKEGYLRQRLLDAGHEETQAVDGKLTTDFDVLLVDCDWHWAYPRPLLIEGAKQHDAKVAIYPHGGRPTVWVYDGIGLPRADVDLRLEHGRGSIEMAKMFTETDLKQQAPGWLYSPTAEFQPVEKPRKILFAPLHPNIEMLTVGGNGNDPAPALNQRIYKDLLGMKAELTVSIAGPPWRNGLWAHPRAKFIPNPTMRFEQSLGLIDAADVVVAAGTMATTAVARGKPTVMFDQDVYMDYLDGDYVMAQHQGLYEGIARYPIDVADGRLEDLIEIACREEVKEWRDRWIGQDGTAEAIRLLEGLVERPEGSAESEVKHVTIQGVTARAITKGH